MCRFKIFTASLCLFIFSGISSATVLLDRVVAVVNNEVITWGELYRAMETDVPPETKALTQEEKRKIFKENEASFLESYINLRLQLQEAKNIGIRVTEEEVNEATENIKKKYSMIDAEFRESLKKEGYAYEEYKNKLKEQIIISKLTSHTIRSKIIVPSEDIDKYIEENKNKMENAGDYRISQIFFKKPKNDEERISIEEKAASILKKIKSGEDFRALAKQYSEDSSANAGGDLGFIKKAYLAKEFSEALSVMKKGDVSNPFWTGKGIHIIKLDEKIEPEEKSEIREEVKKILSNKIFTDRYNAWIKGLREKSFIEIRL